MNEDLNDVSLMTVGEVSAACLRAGRLVWLCDLGEPNTWHSEVELPRGLNASDVVALHPSQYGCTLLTNIGDLYVWEHQSGNWYARANLMKVVVR